MRFIEFSRGLTGHGGANSFQTMFMDWLRERKVKIVTSTTENRSYCGAFIVMHGTKNLKRLIMYRMFGKVILRMDGLVRFDFKLMSFVSLLRVAKVNLSCLLSIIFAHKIIVQSHYLHERYKILFKFLKKNTFVINNGVDTEFFKPADKVISEKQDIICVEGTVHGQYAANILANLESVTVNVYGEVDKKFNSRFSELQFSEYIKFNGHVTRNDLRKIYTNHKIYLCLEKNPACPNSVLEALSCGLPIIGLKNGSLPELVGNDAGIIIDYLGLNSAPLLSELLNKAINDIFQNYEAFSKAARLRAHYFEKNKVFQRYLEVLEDSGRK